MARGHVDDISDLYDGSDMQTKLNNIKKNYESVFSWDIKQQTGINRDVLINFEEKIQEKCDINVEEVDEFVYNRLILILFPPVSNTISHYLRTGKTGHYLKSYFSLNSVTILFVFIKHNELFGTENNFIVC